MDESELHALGRSHFVDDLPLPPGTLHAAPVLSGYCQSRVATHDAPLAPGGGGVEGEGGAPGTSSPGLDASHAGLAHARLLGIDATAALALPGVKAVLTAADIPGANRIGVVVDDEPLMAEGEVCYCGQVLALVVAESAEIARCGADLVRVALDPLPACLDARAAQQAGALFAPPRRFACGDAEAAFAACAHVASGSVNIGGQEHVYLETQAALAVPRDDGGMVVHASSQSPSASQVGVARVLGLAAHDVEVDVKRLGGGFGGKESQATPWAAMAALAARHCRCPVKLVLRRQEDMRATGKRHPYSADYRIGLDDEWRIVAYQVTFYQNAGAYSDLSLAILERSLFHAGGSYAIPNLSATAWSCRTHLPPFTAMRGFGGPQAMFVLEAAIGHVARASGIPATVIQARSLLAEGDAFPYGQRTERCRARACWEEACARFDLRRRQQEIARFNAGSPLLKKGLACMPIAFGISFTHRPLNQASALVHAYGDGSVGFTTGAVEMGQGVHRKLRRVVSVELGLPVEHIREESANTTRVANVSPSAASATVDLNGRALLKACAALRGRLLAVAAEHLGMAVEELRLEDGAVWCGTAPAGLDWPTLVRLAGDARVSLSAQAHHATEGLYFDPVREEGHPFAYHVYGTALVEVSLDWLRGTGRIERVEVVHDVGRSLDPLTDRGQVEGGVVQGLGWLTSEELIFDAEGRLKSDSLSGYKPPDIHAAPEIVVHFLEEADEPNGLYLAKAVGEPPLLYAIGAYSALMDALHAARLALVKPLDAPLTPERLLRALYDAGS
ncbi:MAG: molybdopterin-dependent oxidoreductase [Rhodocyclaceae bacterium]|nr:molybdopterin-dependent oxidoreductase [Rhodocyclaceae bacterium]